MKINTNKEMYKKTRSGEMFLSIPIHTSFTFVTNITFLSSIILYKVVEFLVLLLLTYLLDVDMVHKAESQ